jgi:hypothetical protein
VGRPRRLAAPRRRAEDVLHPQVGRLELECQTLIAESESQILLIYTARPGTESADRLRLLGVVGSQEFADAAASHP